MVALKILVLLPHINPVGTRSKYMYVVQKISQITSTARNFRLSL